MAIITVFFSRSSKCLRFPIIRATSPSKGFPFVFSTCFKTSRLNCCSWYSARWDAVTKIQFDQSTLKLMLVWCAVFSEDDCRRALVNEFALIRVSERHDSVWHLLVWLCLIQRFRDSLYSAGLDCLDCLCWDVQSYFSSLRLVCFVILALRIRWLVCFQQRFSLCLESC